LRGPQNVFVNRRIVKDRTIAHAIGEAYAVATIKERSPEVHLFLDVPPTRVDCERASDKAEVRFLEQSLVHEVVRRALGDALGQGRAPELQLRPGEPGGPSALEPGLPGVVAGAGLAGSRWAPITSVFARPGQPEGSAAAMTSTGPSTVDADPFARSVAGRDA